MLRKVLTTIVFIIALAILLSLGFWQLQRLEWKTNLIAQVQLRQTQAHVDLPSSPQRGIHEFMRVKITGKFLSDKEARYYVVLPLHKGGEGYYLITPFQINSGALVLVNRGFVPKSKWPFEKATSDEQTIEGVIRFSEKRSYFAAIDDIANQLYFLRDAKAIFDGLKLKGEEVFIDRTGVYDKGLPQLHEARYTLPNNHLDYALTWFGLALTMLIIFGILLYRERKK